MSTHFPHKWKFPPIDHPTNALFNMDALRERLEREDWRDWITLGLRHAKWEAERFFAAEPEARAFVLPVWRADGSVQLVRIGKRGGHKVLWTFHRD